MARAYRIAAKAESQGNPLEWLALLDRHGFDPAALELSELGKKTLKETVF